MERHVKERLIGAAVLVAAAVILIPEMLSGPKRPPTPSTPTRAGEAPMKTYTIDLNHSPDAPATAPTVVDERAPPAEVVASEPQKVAPAPEPPAQSVTSNTPSPEESRKPQTIPESAPVKPAPAPQPPRIAATREPERTAPAAPAMKPEPKPLAPAASAPTSVQSARQWAVQLGSFSSKATADKLAKDWDARGQQAFVMPVKSGNNTLYRVRLGPFSERSAADDALRKTGSQVAGAAVVAHP